MKEIILKENEIDYSKYFITNYFLESETKLEDAALAIAIGQTWGNPEKRAGKWENPDLIEKYCAKIIDDGNLNLKTGHVRIAFPVCNLDWIEDGIPQLLAIVQGGNLDIKNIKQCHVLDIEFPNFVKKFFKGPKFGLSGLRNRTNCYNKPLLMAICKPKLMDSPKVLLEMVKQLADGKVNIIKLDEINSSPPSCKFEDRIGLISEYLKDMPIVYFDCITGEHNYVLDRARKAHDVGLSGIHVNHWAGWGIYRTLRSLDLSPFIFVQRSGDKCVTDRNHRFHIKWSLMCKLLGMSGADVVHGGMLFGYSDDDPEETKKAMSVLRSFNTCPTLSCGFTPNLVERVTNEVGVDYIIGAGGSIHSHKDGTTAGALEFRKTIDNLYG